MKKKTKSSSTSGSSVSVAFTRETTSATVASIAGQLLGSKTVAKAEAWLHETACRPYSTAEDRECAATLIGTLASLKSVAASALTQAPDKK